MIDWWWKELKRKWTHQTKSWQYYNQFFSRHFKSKLNFSELHWHKPHWNQFVLGNKAECLEHCTQNLENPASSPVFRPDDVLGSLTFNSFAMLVNIQLVWSCQLSFKRKRWLGVEILENRAYQKLDQNQYHTCVTVDSPMILNFSTKLHQGSNWTFGQFLLVSLLTCCFL